MVRLDADEDGGRWVTTENDHRIHINEEGDIDKGNPHVIKAINGFRVKNIRSIPTGARVRSGDTYYVKRANGEFVDPVTGKVADDDELARCKRDCESKIKIVNGDVIDFGDKPLEYGPKEKFNENATRRLRFFEKEYKGNRNEAAMLLDENGDQVGGLLYGSSTRILIPHHLMERTEVITHLHPSTSEIGGTFSEADIDNFSLENLKTIRAISSEVVYSITVTDSTDRWELRSWYTNELAPSRDAYRKKLDALRADILGSTRKYRSGEIDQDAFDKKYNEYVDEHHRLSGEFAVISHNLLLSGQEKFHYNYTLERWDDDE